MEKREGATSDLHFTALLNCAHHHVVCSCFESNSMAIGIDQPLGEDTKPEDMRQARLFLSSGDIVLIRLIYGIINQPAHPNPEILVHSVKSKTGHPWHCSRNFLYLRCCLSLCPFSLLFGAMAEDEYFMAWNNYYKEVCIFLLPFRWLCFSLAPISALFDSGK